MADLVKFVSKTELDAKKAKRREARETILRKAKEDYETKERELGERKQRGEDVWMLPSLSRRLSESSSEDEPSKKKKHKSGKKKKKKKKKKNKSDSEEDEWVEKGAGTSENVSVDDKSNDLSAAPQRESWMLFPLSSKHVKKETSVSVDDDVPPDSNKDSKEISSTSYELGQHPRELNPYWKEGGRGLPSVSASEKAFTSSNRAWFKRAYERAKQQAEDEGRSLEDVAAERWGSLEKLQALANGGKQERDNSEERTRDRDDRHDVHRGFRNDSGGRRYHGRDHNEKERDKGRRKGHQDERDSNKERFRRPIEEQRNSLNKLMKPPEEDMPSTSKSSTWDKKYESYRSQDNNKKVSGRWRKKQDKNEVAIEETTKPPKEHEKPKRISHESSDSESSEEDDGNSEKNDDRDDDTDSEEKKLMSKRVTEADLNALGAKRLKAELMGNEELAKELEVKLDKLRKIKEKQEQEGDSSKTKEENDNVVVLTRTDRMGNVVPVESRVRRENTGKRRKRHKNVPTHDDEGKRSRYFCDDDDYDLNSLVAREKMSTAEDQNTTYARLAHKLGGQFDLDDKFESAAASKYTPEELEEKARQKAIREHQRLAAQMENCKYCLDSRDLDKHLIIAIGLKVYLALPSNQSLSDGHCFLIPIMHHTAGTMVDEDVWSEIQVFKKGLTKLFEDMGKDVVFMEMNRNLHKKRHMLIECVPLDKEVGDMAPIYFKKAILESDAEWAQNKKLIDTRKKNLRSSVPKGLPYFSVEFGLDGGFAHVIENEDLIPPYFGKEIVGGMLELEPFIWKKPRKENFQAQKKKVLQFADWWKPYDWTQKIKKK